VERTAESKKAKNTDRRGERNSDSDRWKKLLAENRLHLTENQIHAREAWNPSCLTPKHRKTNQQNETRNEKGNKHHLQLQIASDQLALTSTPQFS
tara:strand:- start:575 stop:859 length:285 start_codon:yes stop_codon:yes gene_type:complete